MIEELKKNLLLNIEKSINDIIYEKNKVIQNLSHDIQVLRAENSRLLEENKNQIVAKTVLEGGNGVLLQLLLKYLNEDMLDLFMDEFVLLSPEATIQNITELIIIYLQNHEYERIADILNRLSKHTTQLTHKNENYLHQSKSLLHHFFDEDQVVNHNEEFDVCLKAILKFISSFAGTIQHNEMIGFLSRNILNISTTIFMTNSSTLIVRMIECMSLFKDSNILEVMFDQLLEEWTFIEDEISIDEFDLFLRVACYLERDDELENILTVETFIANSNHEIKTNSQNKEIKLKSVSKLPKKGRFHPVYKNSLKEKMVKLAIYQNKYTNEPDYYEEVIGLYGDNLKEFYTTKYQISRLKRKVNNPSLYIEVNHKDQEDRYIETERIALQANEMIEHPITSSTVITPIEGTTDELELSSKSELRELGYQITGLTRMKRWEILTEKAIPKLGLKKVAYTIAFLVRGRKAMKNGLVRNRNAIMEWEFDLEKLKKFYFKNDFVWPSTTVNK